MFKTKKEALAKALEISRRLGISWNPMVEMVAKGKWRWLVETQGGLLVIQQNPDDGDMVLARVSAGDMVSKSFGFSAEKAILAAMADIHYRIHTIGWVLKKLDPVVAQLVERGPYKAEGAGSTPADGIKTSEKVFVKHIRSLRRKTADNS